MNTNILKKSLVITVILLFIGVAIVPSINFCVVKASNDNDLVEVTTQACGIQGYGNNTVKLTREQYQNLEQYLVEFRARLNQTTTREEAVPIFKEAVVELDKYGLLPKGMSVETAQSLVTGRYYNAHISNLFKKIGNEYSNQNNRNLFCLIAGHTSKMTEFTGLITQLLYWPGDYFPIMAKILYQFFYLSWIVNKFIPFSIIQFIGLGGRINYGPDTPAIGWVFTIGLNGIKIWNGELYGHLPTGIIMSPYGYFYVAVDGFTGLKISLMKNFFIGTAYRVAITY